MFSCATFVCHICVSLVIISAFVNGASNLRPFRFSVNINTNININFASDSHLIQ